MRPSSQLTPYPVLADHRDDYLNSSFSAEVIASQQFGNLQLRVSFTLDEPNLESLIDDGKAEYAIHVECPSTSFRECKGTRSSIYTKTLDRNHVKGVVEICTFIVAREGIAALRSDRFHPDYYDASFVIDEGGVLAIGPCVQVSIESEDDIARHSSILSVTKAGPGQQDSMAVNTDQANNVLISLREDLYEVYVRYGSGNKQDLILSLVILPALQIVLMRMMEAGESGTDSEKEWFKSIVEILERNGVALDNLDNFSEEKSVLAVAQRILSQPLERSLMGFTREEY